MVKCPRCGTEQDPNHPLCAHMIGAKGGKNAHKTIMEKYGREHYREAGRKGAAIRWHKNGTN